MSMLYVIIILIIQTCANINIDLKFKSPENTKHSLDNIQRVQDLSQRIPAGVGYLPIEEIIRKTNLTNIQIVDVPKSESTTTEKPIESKIHGSKVKEKYRYATIKVIIKGSDAQVSKIPYVRFMRNMHLIDKVNLPMKRKMLIWNIIKKHKPIERIRKSHLKKMRKFLYDIPENDFVNINVTDWKIVKYLGVSKIISRRQAGIIGYAMKHKWGKDIIEKPFFINKMKGLICGFSQTDLQSISPANFTKIDASVFSSVWACTHQQLKILLNIAIKPHAYGPLEVWTNQTVRKVGLLMTLLQPGDFKKLNSMAFEGLNTNVIEMMNTDQVNQFNQEQILYLDEQALMLLKEKIATINKDNGTVVTKALDLIILVWIMFFMKSV